MSNMKEYLKRFDTHAEYEEYLTGGTMVKPNVSYCEDVKEVHYNPWTWADEYFTTVALEDGTISFNITKNMGTEFVSSISYSTDGGETWTTTDNTDDKTNDLTITVNVSSGDKVLWKGNANYFSDFTETAVFSSTCRFDVMGNIMSLLYGDEYKNKTTISNAVCFGGMFGHCNVINAKNLSLPATTLSTYCYMMMFGECTNLITAPELPATTVNVMSYGYMFSGCTSLTAASVISATSLAEGSCMGMFSDCTSLVTAPTLPATTLAKLCYSVMFQGCTSLTTAPELPATILAESCYGSMFYGCTSLVNVPELHATTLAKQCCQSMFEGCTSLVKAPTLPATTLVERCYQYIFQGCRSLNYIKAMFTTTPSNSYTYSWVSNVAASGTFVKNSAATWNPEEVRGVNGVPTNWTVQTASE